MVKAGGKNSGEKWGKTLRPDREEKKS